MDRPETLVAVISGEEMVQTGALIEATLHGPEADRVEAIRDLMRYTRRVLDMPEEEPSYEENYHENEPQADGSVRLVTRRRLV